MNRPAINRRQLLAATGLAGLAGSRFARAQGASSSPPGDARAPALPPVGTPLAVPDLTLLDGTRLGAGAAQGKVVVIYWWASWCPFCAVQSPHVEKLWRKEKARGLQVLALSIDSKPEAAANYLQQKGYTFPAAMLTPDVAKVLPKPKGLPVIVVRGRDGKVVFAESGEMFPEDIEGLAKFL